MLNDVRVDEKRQVRSRIRWHVVGERSPRIRRSQIGAILHDVSFTTGFIARLGQNHVAALDGDLKSLDGGGVNSRREQQGNRCDYSLFDVFHNSVWLLNFPVRLANPECFLAVHTQALDWFYADHTGRQAKRVNIVTGRKICIPSSI